ncbi:MAG: DUF1592 domain-containing protein, partial [Myxococcota bacterium]
ANSNGGVTGGTAANNGGVTTGIDTTPPCVGAECVDIEPCTEAPCGSADAPPVASPTTRFARLTHRQWENTVRDLLRLSARPNVASTFIPDATSVGFSTNTESLDVSPELWADYQRGSEVVADRIASDAGLLGAIMPANMPDGYEARKAAFLGDFLPRAFRRPVSDTDMARYNTLFDVADAQLERDDPFVAGVEMTLRAVLQSPHFVFRVELSEQTDGQGRIPLNGYEVASRLSFALWDTMPSDELLDAAGRGELSDVEQIRGWIARMLEDSRAHELVGTFHEEMLRTNLYADLTKNSDRYPEFTADTGLYMRMEIQHFIEDTIFDQNGGFVDLLTSRRTFVNANLASIYGVEGDFTDEFTAVELDPDQRSGLLTRIGFLAVNSSALEQDPIHRGVFVAHDMLCKVLPAPPDNVPPVPANIGNTVRERVNAHTGPGTCGAGCHSTLINPPGFAFENYDALGRYQTEENGFPVDAADVFVIDGTEVSWNNAVEFSDLLATAFEANACYTRHWLEYVYGRSATPADERLIAPVAQASRQELFSVQDILMALLLSDAFLTRAAEEETL